MGWTVSHSAHSPDLASSIYHLFGPVKDTLHGFHFADDSTLKQSFCDALQSQGREFFNIAMWHLTQCWKKRVEYHGYSVEK
jgi:hypothetical protein